MRYFKSAYTKEKVGTVFTSVLLKQVNSSGENNSVTNTGNLPYSLCI